MPAECGWKGSFVILLIPVAWTWNDSNNYKNLSDSSKSLFSNRAKFSVKWKKNNNNNNTNDLILGITESPSKVHRDCMKNKYLIAESSKIEHSVTKINNFNEYPKQKKQNSVKNASKDWIIVILLSLHDSSLAWFASYFVLIIWLHSCGQMLNDLLYSLHSFANRK